MQLKITQLVSRALESQVFYSLKTNILSITILALQIGDTHGDRTFLTINLALSNQQ